MRLEPACLIRHFGWAVVLLCGCSTTFHYPPVPQDGLARTPEITVDPATGQRSLDLSVMIYNVAGLPWPFAYGKTSRTVDEHGDRIPISSNRSAAMRAIGDRLGELRQKGLEPDVVMLQEAFIGTAAEIPSRGGYPNWVAGPSAKETGDKYSDRASQQFLDDRSFWKGEKFGKWQSSGLLLLSNFPIRVLYNHPFKQWECAGFDCLANKGMLVVELAVPGLPEHLAVATVHFNSRGASGVKTERALTAHKLQVAEANEYLAEIANWNLPFIWGGDLNMRRSHDRLDYFVGATIDEVNEVSAFCLENPEDCEIQMVLGGDAPWYETQDIEGWTPGNQIAVTPIRMEKLFDEPVDGVMLSDHDAVLVYYRLTWPVARHLSPRSPNIRNR